MRGFLYGAALQWRLDIRSRTMLLTCYAVPLLFFAVMGGIFTAVMPEARRTLTQSMTVLAVSMGALIGLPPSLVEVYGGEIRRVYQVSGVPMWAGLALTNLSAFLHLFLMSGILYAAAPLVFDAAVPAGPWGYFGKLAVFIAVTLALASVVGLAAGEQARATMLSMVVFLPSILLSGIMFPAEMLPEGFRVAGGLFPAAWGYRWMTGEVSAAGGLGPLLVIFLAAAGVCGPLLARLRRRC